VWQWHFTAGGKQIAFEQETVHGGRGVHYELRDVTSGRLISEYSPMVGLDNQPQPNEKPPAWVLELDGKRWLALGWLTTVSGLLPSRLTVSGRLTRTWRQRSHAAAWTAALIWLPLSTGGVSGFHDLSWMIRRTGEEAGPVNSTVDPADIRGLVTTW